MAVGASDAGSPTASGFATIGVLRDAALTFRRRLVTFSALAVLLSVSPELFAEPAAEALKGVLPAAAPGSMAADGIDLLRSLIDVATAALLVLSGLLLDVAVVVLSLRAGGSARGHGRCIMPMLFRTAPLAALTFTAAFAWGSAAPEGAFVVGAGLISLWILPLTVVAAEALSLSDLPRRFRALTDGRRRSVAALVGGYLSLYVALNEIDLDVPSPFVTGSAAAWAVDAAEASLVAVLAVLAGATAVALYRALRDAEEPSPATLAAFE